MWWRRPPGLSNALAEPGWQMPALRESYEWRVDPTPMVCS